MTFPSSICISNPNLFFAISSAKIWRILSRSSGFCGNDHIVVPTLLCINFSGTVSIILFVAFQRLQ